ncbi:outer membrane beta-barrel protein [Pelomonas sp. SE-A7]|uniref:outer membrane beta-barrel protein n=1 Tax=Pelomonas sp. SE-A7 TaxID=3054953 RepID=UPI00259C8A72|nr:outer membrane beta-barrel protein [Pelomonas sp. SE-A7]MDM4765696.1 outer membrane beta-barrel protein [Pelomonas sp. SE-A7]
MRKLIPTLVLLPALASGLAHASDGPYVGGGLLLRHYDLQQAGTTATKDSAKGHVLSGKLLAGFEFNEHWALETGYLGFGKPGYDYLTTLGAPGRLAVGGHAWYGALRASWDLGNPSWGGFVKLGADRLSQEVSGSGAQVQPAFSRRSTELYVAAGLKYKLGPNAAVTVELEHFGKQQAPGNALNGVSTGLQFKF